jgi:pimeloyl-ACP methyl ester carboxylesterase
MPTENPDMTIKKVSFVGKDGLKLAADAGGNPADQPVILLHGGGQTRQSWKRAAQEMIAAGYYCIALDLRGHGESEWSPEGKYAVDDYVGDLMAVIATLQRPPVLVGASLGGVTSLIAVGEHESGLAAALVLVDVVPRMETEGVTEIRDFMTANPDGFASLEEAADAVALYLPGRPRPSSPEGLKKNLILRDNGRYYWHWDPKMHPVDDRGMDKVEVMSARMEAAAHKVDIPTLVVRGAQSKVVSTQGVDHLCELIPHAEYADVANAGHMVAGDRNDQFNSVVEDFLFRQQAGKHSQQEPA